MTRKALIELAQYYRACDHWRPYRALWDGVIMSLEAEEDIRAGFFLGCLRPDFASSDGEFQAGDIRKMLEAVRELYQG